MNSFGYQTRPHHHKIIVRICLVSIVCLATAPLLRDGGVLVEDVGRHVGQVRILHGAHLGPNVSTLDGWVHLVDLLEAIVSRGVVEVVDYGPNIGPVRHSPRELLKREAYVLVSACRATDVAIGASCVEEALATDKRLLANVLRC